MDPARELMIKQVDASRGLQVVHIYIDNSNIYTEGQRTSAQVRGLKVPLDYSWRYNPGQLREVLTRQFESADSDITFDIALYGSTSPEVEAVWTAMGAGNVRVIKFRRSSWTGGEKKVDAQIIADATAKAADDFYQKVKSEFVIVSGDSDLLPAVEKIVERNLRVHVWAWRSGMASDYRRHGNEMIFLHELDPHLDEVGFRISSWVDRTAIEANDVPVLDSALKSNGGIEVATKDGSAASSGPEKKRKLSQTNERKPGGRCLWGAYCQYLPTCVHGHTEAERQEVRTSGKKTARKFKMCATKGCTRKACHYAHKMGELLCPTCGQVGVGHQMAECPER